MSEENPIKSALKECRPLFLGALLFSFFINILMLAVPVYSMQVLDRVLSSGSKNTLLMLTIIALFALGVASLLQILRATIFTNIGRWLADKITDNLATKTIEISVHDKSIGSQPLRDLAAVRSFLTSSVLGSIFDAPWAILFFIVLYMINLQIGIIVTIGALIILILTIFARKIPSARSKLANQAQINAYKEFDGLIRNSEVIKAMGFISSASNKWRQEHEKNIALVFSSTNIGTVISNITKSFRMTLQIAVTGIGAYFVIQGKMSVGSIIAVSILTGKALAPFDASVAIYEGLASFNSAMKRLKEVLRIKLMKSGQALELPEPVGNILVEKLSIQDSDSQRWLLKNINFELMAGESLGIIGPSGSGKTTLSRALVGVLLPTTGSVRLDGADLQQWQSGQLGNAIGYLPQDIELFSGTIAQNIARMNEQAKDEDIIKAAKLACVHDFILAMPLGYQTDIGNNGNRLSAGQRQRIALARCFFGNPKLIVLDEPNSNLDTDGEMALLRCLENAKGLKITIIIVAHRPSILGNVNKIAVLNAGELKKFDEATNVIKQLTAQTNQKMRHKKPSNLGKKTG